MQRKYLVNAIFVAAIVLAVFLFLAVPISAATGQKPLLFVTRDGQTLQLQQRSLQNNVVSFNWLHNEMLVRRHLVQTSDSGINLLSYYDGSQTWTITPAEPILRYLDIGSTWEWQGTVTVGSESYLGRMQYQIGPTTTAVIGGREMPVTQVFAYGRIGRRLIVREHLFSPELGLVKEEIAVSVHGDEKVSATQLAQLQ